MVMFFSFLLACQRQKDMVVRIHTRNNNCCYVLVLHKTRKIRIPEPKRWQRDQLLSNVCNEAPIFPRFFFFFGNGDRALPIFFSLSPSLDRSIVERASKQNYIEQTSRQLDGGIKAPSLSRNRRKSLNISCVQTRSTFRSTFPPTKFERGFLFSPVCVFTCLLACVETNDRFIHDAILSQSEWPSPSTMFYSRPKKHCRAPSRSYVIFHSIWK